MFKPDSLGSMVKPATGISVVASEGRHLERRPEDGYRPIRQLTIE